MTNPNGWTGGSGGTIRSLSDEQMTAFFAAIEKAKDPVVRARDNCLFHLLLSYGLRCLEAKLLRLDNVNLKTSPAMIYVTRVKEKHIQMNPKTGEKTRVEKARRGDWYPLSSPNEAKIRAWLKVRKSLAHAEESPSLFLTRQAPTISTNSINFLTHQYGKKAGMARVFPHMFRHTCATRMARLGFSAFEIKERLGHVSVLSSEVYVRLSGPERLAMNRRVDRALEGNEEF